MLDEVRGRVVRTSKVYCQNFGIKCDSKRVELNPSEQIAREGLLRNGWIEYKGKLFCPQCVKEWKNA